MLSEVQKPWKLLSSGGGGGAANSITNSRLSGYECGPVDVSYEATDTGWGGVGGGGGLRKRLRDRGPGAGGPLQTGGYGLGLSESGGVAGNRAALLDAVLAGERREGQE